MQDCAMTEVVVSNVSFSVSTLNFHAYIFD